LEGLKGSFFFKRGLLGLGKEGGEGWVKVIVITCACLVAGEGDGVFLPVLQRVGLMTAGGCVVQTLRDGTPQI
jgi:hypothetical protein